MATAPQQMGGGATEGYTCKQYGMALLLSVPTLDVLEMAQRLAAQVGATTVEPVHVLCRIVFQPRNSARRAREAMGADMAQLEALHAAGSGAAPSSWKAMPIGTTTRYMLNHAHREAEQLGHYRVDPLHMLLALLYKDSTPTAEILEKAGVTFYALRQYLTTPGSVSKSLRDRRRPALDGAARVSPAFAIPAGAMIIGGAGLWSGAAPGLTLPLSILLVVGGWVTSLCIHEFGHAFIAYLGGDRSVASAGYLSLNPLKYTHPVLSIALPVVFLLIGGIGLPGGAVYLNERAIRNDRWRSFASAAGPLGNLLFAVLIGWPFLVFRGAPPFGDFHFWAALAFLVFLQVTAVVLNLIPIPPFDGFGIIAPWLSIELRILASRLGMLPMLLLFFLLWRGGPISAVFWDPRSRLANLLNVPEYLVYLGQQQFPHL